MIELLDTLAFPAAVIFILTAIVIFFMGFGSKGVTGTVSSAKIRQHLGTIEKKKPGNDSRRRNVQASIKEMEERQQMHAEVGAAPGTKVQIAQANLNWSMSQFYTVSIIVGVAVAILLYSSGLMLVGALGVGIAAGALLPHLYIKRTRTKRFDAFIRELPSAVDIIVRGVKSGLPVSDCLKIVATESKEPLKSEFERVNEELALGVPFQDTLLKLYERISLQEVNFLCIVLSVQMQGGGNLSEALTNLSNTIRARFTMKAKVQAMSMEAKASASIIGSMPPAVMTLIHFISPEYVATLFNTFAGNMVLAGSLLWMGIGIFVMKNMINFEI